MQPAERDRRIWQVVAAIPEGRVMSYGEVARRAGLSRGARLVGKALQAAPAELALPWHRVLRADGSVAFPPGSRAYRKQVQSLRAEGVTLIEGRIRSPAIRNRAELDRALWGLDV